MKVLHTADLHIKDSTQLSLLQVIINLAKREHVDLILIAGDLFDASAQFRELEALAMKIWESFSGSVLIVAGNHDARFLKGRTSLAPNVSVASQLPYSVAEISGIYFVCVPYQNHLKFSDLKIPFCDPGVLVIHTVFSEDMRKGFVVNERDISRKYRYVALGHQHQWEDRYIDGVLIVNPGAPRKVTRSDEGIRYVSIVDTDSWLMERIALPSSFLENKTLQFSVSYKDDEIQDLIFQASLLLQSYPNAELTLTLKGSILSNEYSLEQRIAKWKNFLQTKFIDVSRIRWHSDQLLQISPQILYAGFTKMLVNQASLNFPEEIDDLASFAFERMQFQNEDRLPFL